MMFPKHKPVRSRRIREAARGQPCTVQLPVVCDGGGETTVLAHPPIANGGMGTKGSDLEGAFACAGCHDVLDGRTRPPVDLDRGDLIEYWARGAMETRRRLVEAGIVRVEGAE